MKGAGILFEGELFADYHQVYIQDAGLAGEKRPDLPEIWTDDDVRRRLRVNERTLVVSTARNMMVPLRVESRSSRPDVDAASCDHVAESGLFVPSGHLIVAGLMEDRGSAARVTVRPGYWHALALFEGLGRLSADGLDGEDRYTLLLWPAAGPPPPRPLVHKQWEE